MIVSIKIDQCIAGCQIVRRAARDARSGGDRCELCSTAASVTASVATLVIRPASSADESASHE
ncbi:MAG TPA: hypothetical protein VLF18_11715, partial [Tahibacter sp.]|uniref:hypothetical protein n=1 Tax=Tahibacter sp. TaxID=2056211 RepID=UPI002CE8B5BF